jgi:hypothetical protein
MSKVIDLGRAQDRERGIQPLSEEQAEAVRAWRTARNGTKRMLAELKGEVVEEPARRPWPPVRQP